MKIKYNAPVTLTFALLCSAILAADQTMMPGLIQQLFTVPGKEFFDFQYFPGYVKLFTHALGHIDWSHLIGNMFLILLLGPILEERYGSKPLAIMILFTAGVTGLVNVVFFSTALVGASGIAFMMILLVSFTNIKKGEIPITFLLIVALYLTKELTAAVKLDDISQISHITGGVCGGLFGFLKNLLTGGPSGPSASGPPPGPGSQSSQATRVGPGPGGV